MKNVTAVLENAVMSSVEIAELTGKAHKNVLVDIRTMLDELKIQPVEFETVYRDTKGESRPCFNLPPREVKILITGYSIPLRAKVIDRLEELERRAANPRMTQAELTASIAQTQVQHERQLTLVQAAIDDMKLTETEFDELYSAIKTRQRCISPSNYKVIGLIQRDLKKQFLQHGSVKTIKDISRSSFKEALVFVQTYDLPRYFK